MKKMLNFEKYFESTEPGDLEVINYELPDEVKKTTLKILRDNYDRVKNPTFHSNNGNHIVEFTYRPLSITIGACISFISAIIILVIHLFFRRRPHAPQSNQRRLDHSAVFVGQ